MFFAILVVKNPGSEEVPLIYPRRESDEVGSLRKVAPSLCSRTSPSLLKILFLTLPVVRCHWSVVAAHSDHPTRDKRP
jgi:hypothetical protein